MRFHGPASLDDVYAAYLDHDLLLVPSLPGEGIPRVLLEAMAAGLPVITTRVAGIPSLITDTLNGLLIDAGTAEAIAAAVLTLRRDGDLRRRLIQGGYRTARAHTLDIQAEQMIAVVAGRLGLPLICRAQAS
jgi:glycosyltransferase involved in cell wall biosynthesis